MGQNQVKAFSYPSSIFDVQKCLAQAIARGKKIIHNLKVRQKFHAPAENCPISAPKNIGRLLEKEGSYS